MEYPLVTILILFAACLLFSMVLLAWRDQIRTAGSRTTSSASAELEGGVSLVVPARNAAGTITALLQDLFAQDLPKTQVEVIVVDDLSEDDTTAIVERLRHSWPQLRIVKNAGSGKKAAIMTAVQYAAHSLVLLTDADARCGPQRASTVLREMSAQDLDLLLLPVCTDGERGLLGRLQEEEQAGLLGMAAGEAMLGRPSLANGANMAFTREAFRDVGGYDGDRYASGDDVFLVQRMKMAGKRIGYLLAPEVMVRVEAERSWSGFMQQRLRWSGKMRGVRGASIAGLLGLLLPVFLLIATVRIWRSDAVGIEVFALLVLAWACWLFPVPALVAEVRRMHGKRSSKLISIGSFLAFTLYAPLIAVLSMVVRPVWKGRRI